MARPMTLTGFLVRNRHPLSTVAVLAVGGLLVLHQLALNESTHVRLREDLILLERSEHHAEASHVYQHLVQKLPGLSLTALIDDLERMTMMAGTKSPAGESLTTKYLTAVRRELEQRASRRLPAALERAHQGQP